VRAPLVSVKQRQTKRLLKNARTGGEFPIPVRVVSGGSIFAFGLGNQLSAGALPAGVAEGVLPMNEARSRLIVGGQPAGSPRSPAKATLIGCPPIGPGNYVLLRRGGGGDATLLGMGRLVSDTPSLNLALIRRRGAELGANEVHWFASADS
jgi:hypothetical protein